MENLGTFLHNLGRGVVPSRGQHTGHKLDDLRLKRIKSQQAQKTAKQGQERTIVDLGKLGTTIDTACN